MKKILITGVVRGLGKSLAEFLSNQGHIVYGTTRYLEKVRDSHNYQILSLDLTKKNSIDNLYKHFLEIGEKIDVIIHNAGIAYLDPADLLDEDESRNIFEVNFFGPIYLTKKFLPEMRMAKNGQLIFISSIVSIDHWPYLGVYSASKAAIEAVAFEWAVLLKRWNIAVSVVRPNPLPTDMQIFRSKNLESSPYPDLPERNLEWESISEVCLTVSKIIKDPIPKFAYQTGLNSEKTVRKFLNSNSYQSAIEDYQQQFNKI